jgi:hypothetical protein
MVEFIYRLASSQRSIDNADQVLCWRKVLVIDLRSDVRVGQKSDTPCPMINYIHPGSCHSYPTCDAKQQSKKTHSITQR